MVTKWGLSSKLGPMRYGDESDEPFLGMTAGSSRQDISDETARVIDQEVKSILTDCYDQATTILKEHLDKLHVMAKALVDYETIDSNQIDDIMAGAEPRAPGDKKEDKEDKKSDPKVGDPAEQL